MMNMIYLTQAALKVFLTCQDDNENLEELKTNTKDNEIKDDDTQEVTSDNYLLTYLGLLRIPAL